MATLNIKGSTELLNENQIRYRKIGNRIKQLRLKAGYSSGEKFAYEHDIHRAQYTRYERGMDMRISSLMKIAAAHNMSLHELFKGVV